MSNRYNHSRKNPDDVLTKVKAMIAQKDYEDAWSYITDFLNSRRRSWKQAHDEIMMLFVALCVDLRKNPQDGFFKYRLICTTAHLSSLEKCLRELMGKAREKGEEEYKILLEEFVGQDMKDPEVKKLFTQKQFALPHLKYEWIVYRAVLDILRNNQKLDPLYQESVRHAINFCVTLERSSEYRKLCKACRRHLDFIFQRQDQTNHVEIHEPKMLGIYLHTRFELLENATKLHMWQEAYKLITDIHGLKEKSKTMLEPSLLTAYYKKLSQIFLSSDKNLLHACAILKYYNLARDASESSDESTKRVKKDKSGIPSEHLKEEEIQLLGMSCVLAVLSCPMPRTRSQVMGPPMIAEERKDRIMAEKLDFYPRPNRIELLKQLEYEDLLDLSEDLKMLRKVIISDFSPLSLCKMVGGLLKSIVEKSPKLETYVNPIEQATARKVVLSISKMYSTITFERLHSMFFGGWTQRQIEELIIEMVHKNFIWCRMSHQDRMFYFRPADRINRDSFMKQYLAKMVSTINNLCDKELPSIGQGVNRAQFYNHVRENLRYDQNEVGHRAYIIAKAISATEKVSKAKKEIERFNKGRNAHMQNKQRMMEEKKMQVQRQQDEERRRKRLKEEEARRQAKEKAQSQLRKVDLLLQKNRKMKKSNVRISADTLMQTTGEDVGAIKEVVINVIQETKDQIQKKQLEELRQHDYAVREWRKAEIPLLHKKYKEEAADSSEDKIGEWKKQVNQLQEEHNQKTAIKKLYMLTTNHSAFFYNKFQSRREDNYKQRMDIWTEQKEKHEATTKRVLEQKREKREELRRKVEAEKQKREAEMEKYKEQAQARRPPQRNVAAPRPTSPAVPAPRSRQADPARPPQRPEQPAPRQTKYRPPSRRPTGEASLAPRTKPVRPSPENKKPALPSPAPAAPAPTEDEDSGANFRRKVVRPARTVAARPRFFNSTRPAKPEESKSPVARTESTESTNSPSPRSVRPARVENVRPKARKIVRPRRIVRPARRSPSDGVPQDTNTAKYVRPPARAKFGQRKSETTSVRPGARPIGRGSTRPATAVGSPRQGISRSANVRPSRPARSNEPSLPSQVSSPRDQARNSIDGALNAASGRPRQQRPAVGSWRERESMREKGYLTRELNPENAPAAPRNVRPKRTGGPRRFINSKRDS